jgi:hypothetical protein
MIITLLFTALLNLAAQTEFLPHMVDHQNLGCPENSKCSKKTGLIRQQWVEIAKSKRKGKVKRLKSFSRTFGAPLSVWGLSEAESNDDFIIWDSPCKNHNPEEGQKINLVNVFSKNLSTLKNNKSLIIPKGLLIKEDKKIETVDLLRSDAPILLSNNSVFYVQEIEGIYYSLELKRSGQIQLLTTPKVSHYPSEVQCPKDVSEKFKKLSVHQNLYLGHFCKKIWNVSTNSYQVMALGWSCN